MLKTPITFTICASILFVWLFVMLSSGQAITETQYSSLLLNYGALNGINLSQHEFWKLLTSQFTHVMFFHMLANVAFIYVLGRAIEREFGSLCLGSLYLVSGTVGQFFSVYVYPDLVSSGASQALCGLAGFLLIYTTALFSTWRVTMIAVFVFIAIQIGLDLYFAGYLKAGHVAGFLAGIAFGVIVKYEKLKTRTNP